MTNYRQQLFDTYLSTGFADAYGVEDVKSPYYLRMFAHNVGPHLPTNRDDRIVDIGCGLGHFLYYLLESGYTNVIGVDVGAEQVEFCQKHITPNVTQITSIASFLEESPGPYDVIGFFDVIEHLPKAAIIPALRAMREHLAPEGVLIIRTENMASPIGLRERFGDFTHEVGFTEYSLGQVLIAAGFAPAQLTAHTFYSPAVSWKQKLRAALRNVVQFLWRGIYFAESSPQPQVTSELIMVVARQSL